MKKRILLIISMLIVFSMVMVACAPEPVVEEPVVEEPVVEEPVVEEPVVEEPEVEEPEVEEPEVEEPVVEEPAVEQVLTGAFTTGPGGGEEEVARPWTGAAGHDMHATLYVTPTIFSEDLSEIVPFALESWEPNEDFTVWTYTLRDDIMWSDGEQLTAHDWKFTADFVTDPDYAPDRIIHRALAFDQVLGYEERINGEMDELEAVQVIDDFTIQYTLAAPSPRHFATQFRTYILPEHAIDFSPADIMTTDWWRNPDKQVGSGAFVVAEWERDNYLALEPNEYYFLGRPKLDRIIIRLFGGELSSALLALQAGEIDFTYVEPTDLDLLGDEFNIYFNSSGVVVYTHIHYNEVPEYWQDIKVRQAILYAIDRQAIVEQVLDGTHVVLPCPMVTEDLWHPDVDWFEYDPAQAQALLAEAGVDPSDIVMEWVGHSGYDNLHHNSALQAVQAYLSDIGITMTFRFIDVPSFRDAYSPDGGWTFNYRGAANPVFAFELERGWTNAGGQGGDFMGFDMAEAGLEDAIANINQAPTTEEYFQAARDFCLLHNQTLPDLQMWIGNRYGAASENVANFWWQPAGGGGPYRNNAHLWEMTE